MTDLEDELLAEIVANPDDDGPRLVLADHWTEQGDPRGEFVIAQCMMARLQDAKPFDARAFDSCSRTADALFKQHSVTWLAPFGLESGHAGWARGFLHDVRYPETGLPAEVFRQPVRQCRAHTGFRDPPRVLAALCNEPWPTCFDELSIIATNQPGDEVVDTLAGSPLLGRLRQLDLWTELTDAGARVLGAAAPQLRGLQLQHTTVGSRALAQLLGALELRELTLRDNPAADTPRVVAYCPQLAGLERLILDGPLGDGFAALTVAPQLANLRTLLLWSSALDDGQLGAIAGAKVWSKLERLAIGARQLGAFGMRAIAHSPLTALDCLEVGGNAIGDAGALELAEAESLSNLETLELGKCELTATGALAIVRSQRLAKLSYVDFSGNELRSISIDAAELVRPGLTNLWLADTQLRDDAVESLARSAALADLHHLDLADNPFGDRGARALADSPYAGGLLSLALENVELSEPTRERLVERFGERVRFVSPWR